MRSIEIDLITNDLFRHRDMYGSFVLFVCIVFVVSVILYM